MPFDKSINERKIQQGLYQANELPVKRLDLHELDLYCFSADNKGLLLYQKDFDGMKI